MGDTITTLLVGGSEDEATAIARAADRIEVVPADDRGDRSVDCVVDASGGAGPVPESTAPVVAWTEADPAEAGDRAAYVRRDDPPDRVADAVRWAVARAGSDTSSGSAAGADASSSGSAAGADASSSASADSADGSSPGSAAGADPETPTTAPSPAGDASPSVDLDRVVDGLVDGVLVVDGDDRIVHLNRAAVGPMDGARDAVVGRDLSVLAGAAHLSPEAVERLGTAVEELRADGGVRVLEMEMDPPDADARTVELRATALDDGHVVATVRDVTRRTQTEQALRRSRERIARLHEAAASIVACRTEAELFEEAIDAAERVLEFDVSSIVVFEDGWLVPRALSTGAPSDGVRRMRPDQGLAGETFQSGEATLVVDVADHEDADPARPDYRSGISVPVGEHGVFQAVSGRPAAFDEDDLELADLLMSHVGESLTRIRAEQHLRDRESELRRERDRLAALFENIPDPCVAFNFEDGKPIVRDVNEAFEEVFGYTAEELVGEDIDEYVVPEGYEDQATDMNETLQAGERLRSTSKRLTADGVRDFLIHVVPFKVGERTVQGYGIYSDITDQKERERELRRQNERLDEFASMVSHDLRNPLTLAQGFLESARETGDAGAFDEIAAAHDRMARMIDELLTLARRGDVLDEVQPVDLAGAVDRAWRGVDTAEATLAIEGDAAVEADPNRLEELFENLFRNAVEHAGTDARVRVGPLDGGFFVADDGPGIPPGERDRVLESGYTTREDGTGFGLHIVAEIADAHGWSVSIGDAESGGARFEFVPEDEATADDSPDDAATPADDPGDPDRA